MASKIPVILVIVILLLLSISISISGGAAAAAEETASCAEKLIPCSAFMNSTNPPASCCTPLKQAIEQELECLCNLYSTPGLLQSFGVNVTQALQLPHYCKISGDLSACSKTNNVSASSPPTPSAAAHVNDKSFSTPLQPGVLFFGLLLFWVLAMMIN